MKKWRTIQMASFCQNPGVKKGTFFDGPVNPITFWNRNQTLCKMSIIKQAISTPTHLVGGFNPSEKYARQIGNLPQIGMKIKQYLIPPPTHWFWQKKSNSAFGLKMLEKNLSVINEHLIILGPMYLMNFGISVSHATSPVTNLWSSHSIWKPCHLVTLWWYCWWKKSG